ncbi:MAG TPA: hypothetical protein PKA58_21455, partial [Polyangium sp.]|nr:hypothetical protein [Polyangium sp.]
MRDGYMAYRRMFISGALVALGAIGLASVPMGCGPTPPAPLPSSSSSSSSGTGGGGGAGGANPC